MSWSERVQHTGRTPAPLVGEGGARSEPGGGWRDNRPNPHSHDPHPQPLPTKATGCKKLIPLEEQIRFQGLSTNAAGELAMAFGDIRVAERADWMIERIAALGTVVLKRIGETRAGEMAAH